MFTRSPTLTFFSNFFDELESLQGKAFPVDVKDASDKIVVEAELPGFNEKDIHVEAEDDFIIIEANRPKLDPEKTVFIINERNDGKFIRKFWIKKGLDTDNIKADFKDGILTLEIPKNKKDKKIVTVNRP